MFAKISKLYKKGGKAGKMMMIIIYFPLIDQTSNHNSLSLYSAGHHDLHRSKTLISPSNNAQNANPGTVLETARPEDSKTPPTC